MPEFVALAAALRAPLEHETPHIPQSAEATPDETRPEVTALDELALARLAALEAYERAVPRLLAALARDVLGRELRLEPSDLASLAASARDRFCAEEPVALWVSPGDVSRVRADLPVRVDPALAQDDLVLEVRDGELDARFPLRLAAALASVDER